jgi:hypothetical protein
MRGVTRGKEMVPGQGDPAPRLRLLRGRELAAGLSDNEVGRIVAFLIKGDKAEFKKVGKEGK